MIHFTSLTLVCSPLKIQKVQENKTHLEFIISFLVNRYFHVVMLITKAVFVDKSTVKTSSSIILSF